MKIYGILNHGSKKDSTGRYINEDGLKILEFPTNKIRIGIIMDGATGIGRKYEIDPGITSAEWYVKTMLIRLTHTFTESPTIPLEKALEQNIAMLEEKIQKYKEENNMELTEYEEPSASISIVRVNEEITELYMLGDTTTIVNYTSGEIQKLNNPNEEKLKSYDQNVINEMVKRAKESNRNVIDTKNDPEIQRMLEINRAKKNANKKDSYYVCGTVPTIVNQGIHYYIPNATIKKVICITDGVEYDVLGDDENTFSLRIEQETLEEIVKKIRIMQQEDAFCNQFPRFKQSDDIAFLVVDYKKQNM